MTSAPLVELTVRKVRPCCRYKLQDGETPRKPLRLVPRDCGCGAVRAIFGPEAFEKNEYLLVVSLSGTTYLSWSDRLKRHVHAP